MKNYSEATAILAKIESSQRILLVLHVNPDLDSVGSNLALQLFLKSKGKKVTVLSCDKPDEELSFLPDFFQIKQQDPYEEDLLEYDLYLSLDSADKQRITRHTEELCFPESLSIIVLDHHYLNPRFGEMNIVDDKASSTAEILFNLFKQWNYSPNQQEATCLLAAVAGDTGTFRWASTADTLKLAGELLESGADIKSINFHLYKNVSLKSYKYMARVFEKMEICKVGKRKFVWAALPFSEIEELGGTEIATGVSDFFATVSETDFGLSLKEEEKGRMNGSLRSRTDINVADLAKIFGGGGHQTAAGFSISYEGEFEDKVKAILDKIVKAAK